jgi:hypothetical protein
VALNQAGPPGAAYSGDTLHPQGPMRARLVLHPPGPARPGPQRGAPGARGGSAGGAVALGRGQGMSSALAGCCRQVASDTTRGPRPRLGSPGAFRAQPDTLGRAGSPWDRPAPTRAAGFIAASTLSRDFLTCASSPPAPKAASTPSGPRAARPEPTQASQPASQRGGATGYETGSLRPFRHRGHRLPPSSPGPRARPPPPPQPLGTPGCG